MCRSAADSNSVHADPAAVKPLDQVRHLLPPLEDPQAQQNVGAVEAEADQGVVEAAGNPEVGPQQAHLDAAETSGNGHLESVNPSDTPAWLSQYGEELHRSSLAVAPSTTVVMFLMTALPESSDAASVPNSVTRACHHCSTLLVHVPIVPHLQATPLGPPSSGALPVTLS